MKFLRLFILLFLFTQQSFAQQNHFIYIQTENKQPFFVKLAGRLLNSSESGYLVISKLEEGGYELSIGFPSNELPVQKITITVKNKDVGYLLKNFESKGWGLYNMQTMEVVMAAGSKGAANAGKDTTTDGFADALADVVDAPSIKQHSETKDDNEPVEMKPVAEQNKIIAEIKEEKPAMEQVKPAVKLTSSLDADGRTAIYLDTYDNKTDTIRIFIPYKKEVAEVKEVKAEAKVVTKDEATKDKKKDEKFLDIELPNPNSKKDSVINEKPAVPEKVDTKKDSTVQDKANVGIVMTNMNCKAAASEDDYSKLRKKMAAAKNDDEMISLAKKAFKSKCFSTEQVNNLSGWFLNDEGRYNFFDAVYSHVYDTQNFPGLATKLSDEYYITRFKAMLRP